MAPLFIVKNAAACPLKALNRFRGGVAVAVFLRTGDHGKLRADRLQKSFARRIPGTVMTDFQDIGLQIQPGSQKFLLSFLAKIPGEEKAKAI